MVTRVKTQHEIQAMRNAGKILARVLQLVSANVVVGISTKELADIARQELKSLGGKPTFLGYHGFPDVICISLNDEIVHGIPSVKRHIADGDIVSLDFGVTLQGMITDGAVSLIAGQSRPADRVRLLEATKVSLNAGIGQLRDNVRVGDIGWAIQQSLQTGRYGIPRDLVGHGVGTELWEDPNIPNYGRRGTGPWLKAGMTIAIEPMVTLGTHEIVVGDDGWTVRTADGSLSAHFEHTVLILESGAEVLTRA